MSTIISNQDNVIDSRDVITRIEELENELQAAHENRKEADPDTPDFNEWLSVVADSDSYDEESNYSDEAGELVALKQLADQADCSPDWTYGETLINEDYFTKYIEELIDDCYELPKEFNSGQWPWRHMTINYESAADEAKQDYIYVIFAGNGFWIRV